MSSGFKQMLPGDNLTVRATVPVLEDLCLIQDALTWYAALPSS
jgi:hypothetical protein